MKTSGTGAKKKAIPLGFKLLIAVVCAASVFTTISIQLEIMTRNQELEALNAKIVAQTIENKEILKLVESTEDDGYMERMARGKWGYVYPQERVYVDISGN